jgi:hypothetical protein
MHPSSMPSFVNLQTMNVEQPTTLTRNGQNLTINSKTQNILKMKCK